MIFREAVKQSEGRAVVRAQDLQCSVAAGNEGRRADSAWLVAILY
jgi:hypothetical protein